MSIARAVMNGFDVFVGVDQTGAATSGGTEAKSLPCAVLFRDETGWILRATNLSTESPLYLSNFSRRSLIDMLTEAGLPEPTAIVGSAKVALLVDCVFGLAQEAWPRNKKSGAATLRKLFARAARDEKGRRGYGLNAAAAYFKDVLRRSSTPPAEGAYPVRECEVLANANSVFRTHPYQRNIQCGTYRIWRDLGRFGSDWVHLRFFERASDLRPRPMLFETYPSLMWNLSLDLTTRHMPSLVVALDRAFPDVAISKQDIDAILASPDRADAAVLALGGRWLRDRGLLVHGEPSKSKTLAREGWIAGLTRPQK